MVVRAWPWEHGRENMGARAWWWELGGGSMAVSARGGTSSVVGECRGGNGAEMWADGALCRCGGMQVRVAGGLRVGRVGGRLVRRAWLAESEVVRAWLSESMVVRAWP